MFTGVSQTEFLAYARDSGMTIDKAVERAHDGPALSSTDPYFHSGLLRGVKRACDLLCDDPDLELIDRAVPMPEQFADDVAARTLFTILQTSKEPVLLGEADFEATAKGSKAASCPDADGHFGPAIRLLKFGEKEKGSIDSGASLIHQDGDPLFLVKNHAENTAMSLREFTNNGVKFPAGMLCTVKLALEVAAAETHQIVPVPAQRVARITPTRLLVYAFPFDQRTEANDPDRREEWPAMMCPPYTVTDIHELARTHLKTLLDS